MSRIALASVVIVATTSSVALGSDVARDRAALLADITALERPGAPGNLVVFGDDAFAVVTGGKKQPEAVVAAARAGRGRVVAMAHSGYLDPGVLTRDEGGRSALLRNALAWAGGRSTSSGPARVAVLGDDARLAEALTQLGHQVTNGVAVDALRGHDLLIWKNGAGDAATAEAVITFVERGGGLITAACPWGWAQLRAKQGVTIRDDLPENLALRRFGVVFADGIVDGTRNGAYALDLSRPDDVHAGAALTGLVKGTEGAKASVYLIERALRALPADDDRFLPAVQKALRRVGNAAPAPGRPLRAKDALARLAVTVATLRWRDLAPEDVEPAAGADAFPGAVPKSADRVTRELRLDPAVAGWQGTGLYLPPGEVLTLRVTTSVTGADAVAAETGWTVRIGCHADKLWKKDAWERWPEIAHRVALAPGTTRVATPWGGTVYVEAGAGARPLTLSLRGAVAAPRFVLGDADGRAVWKETGRHAPGPWAELEGRHIVLSVPSAVVRELEDPTGIVAYWDEVVRQHCELAQIPIPARRERFVPDVQISVGYMHSGYPIMMHTDVVTPPDAKSPPPMLDLARLRKRGSWGHFHELGHNRQRSWWTFDGTGEVTCNLFSLHAGEQMAGIVPWENPWLQGQKRRAAPYLAKGAPFAEWRRDPGLALLLFAQMQREFGWEPFKTLFRAYEALPVAERPKTDQQEIDGWVRGMSLAAGRDLRPFWRHWGAPLSAELTEDPALAELPEWMPDFTDLDR